MSALAIVEALSIVNAALTTAASAMQVAQRVSGAVQRAQLEGRDLTNEEVTKLFNEGDALQTQLLQKLLNGELKLEG